MYYLRFAKATSQIPNISSTLEINKLTHKKLFKVFLLISILLHLLFFLSSKRKPLYLNAAPQSSAPLSLRIQTQRPKPIVTKPNEKKIIKKNSFKKKSNKLLNKKEVSKKEAPKEQVSSLAQSTTKNFDSVIANYTQPKYPRMALRRGIMGTVTLTLWVASNGEIDKVELTKSSGDKTLDLSALDAVKQWRFKDLTSAHQQTSYKVEKRIIYEIN